MTTFIAQWYADSPFSSASWVDWFDIGLLAVVVYSVLVVMRGTPAMQSLIGLVLLAALYFMSVFLGLATLHWVLDNLMVYVVILLMILFQEDIRRALARAGGSVFSRSVQRPSDANVMEEVIKAVFALAHRKIGALIVLERNASLDGHVEGAHAIDALASTELLQSIFHPSSPIHDGAVLIARQRIVAAGVFLPISLSRNIARNWGTRHRAAIGITEVTDGLCLVVSEERGTVALVQGGIITPVADANDLRQRLVEHLEANGVSVDADAVSGAGHA